MTEPNADPAPDLSPPPSRARSSAPIFVALLLLAGAVGALWYRTTRPTDLDDVPQRLTAIEARLDRLEQSHPAATAGGPDPLPRIEALERRPVPDLSSIQARLALLERRSPADPDALIGRLAALEQATAHEDRSIRLEGMAIALAAGRKLGNTPGMPPALARFANTAPPTEAVLRLKFPAAERAALDAAHPDDDARPILARLLARAEELVTVRQGEHVLVGAPALGVLIRARTALEAGDLSGTVETLSALRGGAAQAMSAWLGDAIALRDARAALADMAAQP